MKKIRFLDNNLLTDSANVIFSSDTDYDGKTGQDVLDTKNFGVYRLTENVTLGGYVFDVELTAPLEPSSFAIVPNDVNGFYLTSETEVIVQASNFGFDTVEKEFEGIHSRFGAFCDFRETGVDNSFRYWRIWLKEFNRDPSEINESLDIKYIFFGDHVDITERNIATKYSVKLTDNSEIFESESGRRYVNDKPKKLTIDGLRFQYMNGTDRANFQKFYYEYGISQNFLTVIDPADVMTAEPLELMRIMHFNAIPDQSQQIRDLMETSFSLSEAL